MPVSISAVAMTLEMEKTLRQRCRGTIGCSFGLVKGGCKQPPHLKRGSCNRDKLQVGTYGGLAFIHSYLFNEISLLSHKLAIKKEWFTNRRLLRPIGDVPPAEYEMLYYQTESSEAA